MLLLLPYVTLLLLSFLLAGPTLVNKEIVEKKQARQFVIALDISYSMNADDLKPNRLELAKNTIKNLLDRFQGDQVGLVLFAGKPFASIPLTFDTTAIKDMVSQYSTETINQQNPSFQGTAIGDAILASLTLLKSKSNILADQNLEKNQLEKNQSIILITDGSANTGIDPILATKYAAGSGITIYTIGIGSEEGGSIPLQTTFGTRRQKVEGVDTTTLGTIAKISGGTFARVTNKEEFEKALADIANIKPGLIVTETIKQMSPWENYIFGTIIVVILIALYHSYKTSYTLHQTKFIVS